jgi:voltage-gated sodium channel
VNSDPATAPRWQRAARRLVDSAVFQNTIVAVIVVNGLTIGIQTYAIPGWLNRSLEFADQVFLGVFVVELILRFAADRARPHVFFRSGWNVFDFTSCSWLSCLASRAMAPCSG